MPDTPTPETPAELAAKAKRIAMEARFEFEESRYREGNGHKELRLEALNRTHGAIDELESLATLAASSTAPAGECFNNGTVCARCGHAEVIASPAADERKPLTDERVLDWVLPGSVRAQGGLACLLWAVRQTERAHGITAAHDGTTEGGAP